MVLSTSALLGLRTGISIVGGARTGKTTLLSEIVADLAKSDKEFECIIIQTQHKELELPKTNLEKFVCHGDYKLGVMEAYKELTARLSTVIRDDSKPYIPLVIVIDEYDCMRDSVEQLVESSKCTGNTVIVTASHRSYPELNNLVQVNRTPDDVA